MKPIFISYSSKHRGLTRELAAAIEAQFGAGSVWWDQDLESRGSYTEQIKAALEAARAVVVIWTAGATISDFVYAEAVDANAHGKLVNVRPVDVSLRDIPLPFNIHHIDDADDHAGIVATIAKVMTGTPVPTRVPLHEVYYRKHGQRLIDPKQDRVAFDPSEIPPTELLQARYGVVGYIDATALAAALVDWCTSVGRPTAGRLIHGPGGLGKTRLMIEVAAALRRQGWMAGFLPQPDQQADTLRERWQALDQLIAHGDDSGLLIVMDYAEGRQGEARRIADRLSRPPEGDARPIRLVLLARSAGEWWTALHDETPEMQRIFRGTPSAPGVIELPSISTGQQRLALFHASLEAFAPVLAAQGYAPPADAPSGQRIAHIANDAGYTRPLAIQMEALLWLASSAPEAGVTGTDVDALLGRVLGLERRHWEKLAGDLNDERTRDMARGVAQVTAVQGTPSSASGERLLMADDFYKGLRSARVHVDPVLRDLSRVYGRTDGGIAHLEPDLIGEHHVATEGDTELIDGCLRWIASEPQETREKRRRDLLTVLQRATHPEHGAKASGRAVSLLDHLIAAQAVALAGDMVAVMVDTPGALVGRLEQAMPALDDEALDAIHAALPWQSLSLMEVSLAAALRRVERARERRSAANTETASSAEREAVLNNLAARVGTVGIRLSNLGRREEALAASQEAVDIRRRLADARPDAFLPDLASSLNNLGIRLSNLGRREEALAASQEAVDIRMRLADARPDAFLPDLASSLNNLGGDLSNLGRREEALAASQEAVDIYRRLADARPDAFLPDLASSLNNLGIRLSNLGRREEALAASQEAVDIYRRLADARPDAFLPDLASSLNNLGIRLSNLGRREEALAASQEAVDIYRRLADARPDAFLPDLATSLNNLGGDLSNLGRREEALAASQEAVDIYRRLADARPDAFLPDLASSLNNLGIRLSNLGRREEALAASQEAVDIYRRLADARPDAFLPDLAMSLNNLGGDLSNLGRREEALAASQEAVDIRRRLADARPDAFLPDLAMSLNNTGAMLSNLGRREEALAASQEAVDIYRRLADARPDAFLPDLASSLNNLGIRLSNLGRREEALAASQEAVDIRMRLADARPDAFLPDLATSISVQSDILADLGRHAEAALAAQKALRILTPFVERFPQTYAALARQIVADAVKYGDTASEAPDEAFVALVQRISRVLGLDAE